MRQPSSVSVVIPVRNGAAFIVAAIESVLAQTASDALIAQVIVVDNNSTDATRPTVEDFIRNHGQERVTLAFEARPNAANARNTGAALATGEWLAFLDADDLWHPGKLQRQMQARREHPEAELFFTLGAEFLSPEIEPEGREKLPCRPEPYPMLTPSSLLLRREVFTHVGDLPDVPSGEFIAWFGWARELGYKEFVVAEVLVKRRIHGGNSTRAGGAISSYPMAVKWLLDKRLDKRLGRKTKRLSEQQAQLPVEAAS